MRRKPKKMQLSRETLRSLERTQLRGVVGAVSYACSLDPTTCGNTMCFSCVDTCPPTHCDCRP
jgi:hypothetical protein